MARDLLDLLWRDHPQAPAGGSRGPRPRIGPSDVVADAVALAGAEGMPAVTVRRLAERLGVSAMSLYGYVGPREDLLVLMADDVLRRAPRPPYRSRDWRTRVRRIARDNLALHVEHPWLLDVTDQRLALGPGTIAKYDHELAAVEPLGLDDVQTDAALTFVLDFSRAAARTQRPDPRGVGPDDMAAVWAAWHSRLARYLGTDHARAQRVGAAAGAAMQAAYSPQQAWRFGLDRVLAALETLAPHSTPEERP